MKSLSAVSSGRTQTAKNQYLSSISRKIAINPKDKIKMINDFGAAFEYLISIGHTPEDTADIISPERLGTFYMERNDIWYSLDDAAKIYAMSAGKKV